MGILETVPTNHNEMHKSAKPLAHNVYQANNAHLLAEPRGVAVFHGQLSLLCRLAALVYA